MCDKKSYPYMLCDEVVFLGVQVNDKTASGPVSYSMPLTMGELEVIKSIMRFSIPHLLGFDSMWGESVTAGAAGDVSPSPPPAPMWS